MKIKITQMLASNGEADAYDVVQVKKALNRLGYYTPYEKTGITWIPDRRMFDALKSFQRMQDLNPTGELRPGDETERMMNLLLEATPSGYYIWRTVEDGKVRPEHAQYNRTVRAWSDSPDPGEDFNCRCWAEAALEQEGDVLPPQGLNTESLIQQPKGLKQELITPVHDVSGKWTNLDFVLNFLPWNANSKTLSEIGFMQDVVHHAKNIVFPDAEKRISEKARIAKGHSIRGYWKEYYPFKSVIFSFGDVTIEASYEGTIKKKENVIIIDVIVSYEFSDTFTDPGNIREYLTGSSGLAALKYDSSKPWLINENINPAMLRLVTDFGGIPYLITGQWKTRITGSILKENGTPDSNKRKE